MVQMNRNKQRDFMKQVVVSRDVILHGSRIFAATSSSNVSQEYNAFSFTSPNPTLTNSNKQATIKRKDKLVLISTTSKPPHRVICAQWIRVYT